MHDGIIEPHDFQCIDINLPPGVYGLRKLPRIRVLRVGYERYLLNLENSMITSDLHNGSYLWVKNKILIQWEEPNYYA